MLIRRMFELTNWIPSTQPSRSFRIGVAYIPAMAMLWGVTSSCLIAADDPKKVTFDDHVKPIFREHCTSCHNANDKKSGLALDTYQAVMNGGSGGEVVAAGDLDSSRLYALTAHKEQPFMPPNQDMIPQAKVDLLKIWIEQGMPENSGSAIKMATASSAALNVVSSGRPDGPPPMPASMIKQTPFYTPKAATVSALAASPWSPLVAVGGQMQVSLYHSETGELQGVIPFPEGEPQSITFSRDGKLILIGGGRHSVGGFAALYEIETGNRIARVGDELDIVLSADISDDNQLIAVAGPQKIVRVFETLSGKLKYEQKKHTDWIYCVRFSPDGLLLATSDRSSGLVVWEAQSGRLYMDLPGHKSEIRSLAWRPDSQALISGSLDGTLKIWDMNEGKQIKSWDAHGGGVAAVAVCNDGTIASTGRDNKVKVWDSAGNAAGEMPALAEAGHEIAITVDSKQIVAGDWLGNVRLWQRAKPKDEKQLAANPLPLEKALAEAQQKLQQASVLLQADQTDLAAKQATQIAAQQQLTDLQSQLSTLNSQIKLATDLSSQSKSQAKQLASQQAAFGSELTALKSKSTEKTNLINTLVKSKGLAEDAIAALQSLRTAAGADIAVIDAQIAAQTTLLKLQGNSIAQLQTQSQTLIADIGSRDKQLIEIKTNLESKNKVLSESLLQIQQLNATKATSEKKQEPLTAALKTAVDALAAAKAKMETSSNAVAHLKKQVETLQADVVRFNSLPTELASKKAEVEKAIAAVKDQLPPAEASILGTKGQLENVNGEVSKLEMQLASLQAAIAAEHAKRTQAQKELAEKEKALESVRLQLLQSESELGSLSLQQQLFDQAFGKKQ